jgi:hypothetical protein
MVAVPLALPVKLSPVGSAPVAVRLAVGEPVVVTVKVKRLPTVAVAPAADVNCGRAVTTWDTEAEDPAKFGSAPNEAATACVPVVAKLVVQATLPPERTRLEHAEIEPPLSVKFTEPVKAPDPEVSATVAV